MANPENGFIILTLLVALSGLVVASDPEPEKECRRISAAIRYSGVDYLFMGQDSITLTHDLKEKDVQNKEYYWGGLGRTDAALVWSGDGYAYFFEGPVSYYYSPYYFHTYGPYDHTEWDSRLNLKYGVDAAGSAGGKSYLFRYCHYIVFDHGVIYDPQHLQDLNIPCDLDAAFPLSPFELAVIKYDQLWSIDTNSGNVTGPMDANSILQLTSLRICSEIEDQGLSIAD